MKRDLFLVGLSSLAGGCVGYCACLARFRIAGAFLVLAGKAEAKIEAEIKAGEGKIDAEVAKLKADADAALAKGKTDVAADLGKAQAAVSVAPVPAPKP
jgi:hypothetical protein